MRPSKSGPVLGCSPTLPLRGTAENTGNIFAYDLGARRIGDCFVGDTLLVAPHQASGPLNPLRFSVFAAPAGAGTAIASFRRRSAINAPGGGSSNEEWIEKGAGYPGSSGRSDGGGGRAGIGPGYDQGGHPALAVGHHGHQRDDVERRDAHAHRGAEQEGRPARQEARAGGGRSRFQLAVIRREGARAHHQGQGRGGVRLLDLRVAQIRAPGIQGAELDPVLSGAVRGRGERAQRLLHRRSTI
jgi:hypothetical protein